MLEKERKVKENKLDKLKKNISNWSKLAYYKDTLDIKELLFENNIEFDDKNGYLYINCPFHDDSTPSMYICDIKTKPNYGIYNCWGCGAHGNIFDLLELINPDIKYDFKGKQKKIDYFNIVLRKNEVSENRRSEIKLPNEFKLIKDDNRFKRYLHRRNISDKIISEFEVGYCEEGYYAERVIIPLYCNNKLFSFCARSIYTNKYISKHKMPKILYPKNSFVTKYVFPDINLYKNTDFCYIVEGVFDVLRLRGEGFKNVFTTFSNKISPRQQFLLNRFKKIYLIADGDKGGDTFIQNLLNSGLAQKSYYTKLQKGEDPASAESTSLSALNLRKVFVFTPHLIKKGGDK